MAVLKVLSAINGCALVHRDYPAKFLCVHH
jgi:hypothetical protein